ncbi:AbrB/MazE/SpoVT family DNA-binding domain-containing protein [Phreatobacter sp.]|uniref:AbrB/MazE/SpoVT family DNA-binding domain-containing protein n=1 Tax=Phreatobacter sp. TaxID=1966341 RepID=UPI0022BF5D7B|nr:AbrB/MazE/SpoVT family DNA-binding domain-containing protein [Phreatobacter sp.]MCZ8316531.1 AbrB/MazE/SpoVT family DNA-binding domain-containing protein [Phreatobacter sp.]
MATTVTQKGQVTIPKRVRDALGIVPGSKVEFTSGSAGEIIMSKAPAATRRTAAERVARIRGIAGPGMSTDEVMALTRGDPVE